jgi:DNA-binding NarL/FixJ family response regulator
MPLQIVIGQPTKELILALAACISLDPIIQVDGTTTDGVKAVELCESVQPDVMVMNTHLPNMDGMTATEKIWKLHPTAKIVITTVHTDPRIVKRAMDAGVSASLL